VAEGVTVVGVMSTDDMRVEDAPVDVVEYAEARGLQIRICATVTPVQLLRVIEAAEEVIDDPARLSDWPDTTGAAGAAARCALENKRSQRPAAARIGGKTGGFTLTLLLTLHEPFPAPPSSPNH
jgi:hypothetical protein